MEVTSVLVPELPQLRRGILLPVVTATKILAELGQYNANPSLDRKKLSPETRVVLRIREHQPTRQAYVTARRCLRLGDDEKEARFNERALVLIDERGRGLRELPAQLYDFYRQL